MQPPSAWVLDVQQTGLSAIAAYYLWRGLKPSTRQNYNTPRSRFTLFCELAGYRHLVFITGQGGAGFHTPDPALTRGRGGMFRVITALPPSEAHPHAFPGRGPVCYHLFLTETRLGYGWGGGLSGDRGRECRKRHPAPGR